MAHTALNEERVLDLSRVLAAPLATQLPGGLGADVIKVERRGRGRALSHRHATGQPTAGPAPVRNLQIAIEGAW